MMRKAQAAMEFLMTYGWAILVVLIAIGALAYFGVLNPSRFLPESCIIGPGVSCDDFIVSSSGAASLVITNGMGNSLTGVDVRIETTLSSGVGACANVNWNDGEKKTCPFSLGAITPGRYKQDINFTYTTSGTSIQHSKIGSLTTRVT